MASNRRSTPFAILLLFQLSPVAATDADAFRIIATSSGASGIAGAPCCDTGFDGGFDLSTSPFTGSPPVPNVMHAQGDRQYFIPEVGVPPAEWTGVYLAGEARASMFDIGAKAAVELGQWDASLTGGSIEAFASARLDQVFTADSLEDLWARPVFHIDGQMRFVEGFVSSLSFVMRPAGGPDIDLLRIDTGTPDTTLLLDEQLVGPAIPLSAGGDLFLALLLSTQVTANVNDIPSGDHAAEVDAFNTITLLGFETFSDAELTMPANVQFTSDSGETFSSVPEPSTALLLGLGLAGLARAGRRAARRVGADGREVPARPRWRAIPAASH